MIYSQRYRVRNVTNWKPYLYQNYPDFYFRFSLVKVSSLKRMSTNGSEERNRCAIRELKPGRATPQQIQNYPQSPRKNGEKLVSNRVFKQIPGSM